MSDKWLDSIVCCLLSVSGELLGDFKLPVVYECGIGEVVTPTVELVGVNMLESI